MKRTRKYHEGLSITNSNATTRRTGALRRPKLTNHKTSEA